MSTQYEESGAQRAVYQARRVRALLTALENSLGEDRIGTVELDITLRNCSTWRARKRWSCVGYWKEMTRERS
jgi:hypothetical protein